MTAQPLPDDLRRFIAGCVASIDQLEMLRILSGRPEAAWDAASLAREAETDADTAAADLAVLHARGLLVAAQRDGERVYQYGPATPELAAQTARLLRFYRERPVSTIRTIYPRR